MSPAHDGLDGLDGLGGLDGRRILITGHSGFVGSWLAVMLVRLGADVTGYSVSEDEHSKLRSHWLAGLGVPEITGDIRDFTALHKAMAAGFHTVIHLAGQPLVAVGYADPRTTIEVNALGSANLLEAARLCRPTAVIHVTSDKCYRNTGQRPAYREGDELGGGCPYSVSKAVAELIFEGYARLYADDELAPRAASVRFGNVIGGGDYAAHRIVPDCVRALAAGRPIVLRQPAAVRPWQHVLDVCHGLVLLAGALAAGGVCGGEVLNFGPPGDGATARELAEALLRACGTGTIAGSPQVAFREEQLLRLDGSRAAQALGWRHRLDLSSSADWIARWHQAVRSGASPADATTEQVDEYLKAGAAGAL